MGEQDNTVLNRQRQHTAEAYPQTHLSNDMLSQIKTLLLTGRITTMASAVLYSVFTPSFFSK